jgi:hypothetical protein
MVIDLTHQRLRYFKGGQLVGEAPVSTGRPGYSTRTGSFRVIEKDLDHRSSFYGSFVRADGVVIKDDVDVRKDPRPPGASFVGADMRYFMRIVGAIGMHEGYLPGYPASHGCIRLPTRMAAIFFAETPLGTPVDVVGNARLAPPQPTIPVVREQPAQPRSPTPATAARPEPAAKPAVKVKRQVDAPKTQPLKRQRFQRKSAQPKSRPLPPGTTLYLNP